MLEAEAHLDLCLLQNNRQHTKVDWKIPSTPPGIWFFYFYFLKFFCRLYFFFPLWAVSTKGAPGPERRCLVSLPPPAGDLDSTVCRATRSAWPLHWPKHPDTTEHPPPKTTEMVKLDELLLSEVIGLKWSEQERMAKAEISETTVVSPKYAENRALTSHRLSLQKYYAWL